MLATPMESRSHPASQVGSESLFTIIKVLAIRDTARDRDTSVDRTDAAQRVELRLTRDGSGADSAIRQAPPQGPTRHLSVILLVSDVPA